MLPEDVNSVIRKGTAAEKKIPHDMLVAPVSAWFEVHDIDTFV